MALIKADRIRESSTTTGTGAFTLSGAEATFRTFASVCATGDTVYYTIAHRTANEWETGLGTYSATNTLTRTTVHSSSNSGAAVNFSAGTKEVFLALTASQLNGILDTSGITGTLPVAKGGTGATTGTLATVNLIKSAPNDGGEYTLKSKQISGTPSFYWVDGTGYAPTLDLLFAADKSLTAYAGPTPSYSRASTGTYFNASGVLTTAAINAPRFNHVYNGSSWVSKGLLIEEQRTNNLLRSEDLTVTWTPNRGSITSNTTVAPDGTTTADRFVESTANGVHGPVQTPVTTTAAAYTVSGFFRAGTRSIVVMRFQDFATGANGVGAEFNLSAGTISAPAAVIGAFTSPSATISNVGGGWYRCTVTGTANTTQCSLRIETCTTAGAFSAAFFQGSSYTGDGSSYFDSWGYQLELGSFATSYIPTHTAAVTRSADVCQITGGDFSGFWNQPAGALVAEGDTPASGTKSLVSADNATANESTILRTVGTDPLFVVTDGGVEQASIDAGAVSSSTAFKLAAAYTVNDFAVSKDGAAVVIDTSGTIPTPTQITIGTDAAGNYLCGHIARLRYYPVRIPNATLQVLST